MFIGTRQRISNIDKSKIDIRYDGVKLDVLEKTRYLGVILDECLSWDHHIAHINKQVVPKIVLMKRLSNIIEK